MDYVKYILKKMVSILFISLIVSFLVFFMLRLSNVDPVTVMIGNKQSTEQQREKLIEQFQLDEPLLKQYMVWLESTLSGNLGIDYVNKQDIGKMIVARLPVTFGLVIFSSVIGFVIAIIMGVISAVRRGTWIDSVLSVIMLIFTSIPSFLICILVVIFLCIFVPGYSIIGSFSNTKEFIARLSLPSIIMATGLLASLGRVTRSSMITQLQSPYITTAVAKGLSRNDITYKHAFHNAVIPVLTVAGYMFAGSIGATVLIEQIFSLPGIGGLLVTAIQQGNFPVVQILVLLMLTVYLTMSFIVDVLYAVVDPRVEIQ